MATGALEREKYLRYLSQDAYFLFHFNRAYARALTKAKDVEAQATFHALIGGVLDELKLHETTCARWNVDLTAVEVHDASRAYVEFLETLHEGSMGELVAGMVPCMRLYAHLGQSLAAAAREAGSPARAGPYQEWVDTYSASDFEALAASIEALLDRLASAGGQCGAPLRTLLARRYDVSPEQVVLGAGADELLDRACRAWLPSGQALLAPTPCFAMLERYVQAAGATMLALPWTTGALDLGAMDQLARDAALVCVTTPNNPTGLAVPTDQLCELVSRRSDTPFLVDLAYVDYADEDPTQALLQLPNAVVVRTFSKGRSLAGLRVGYALAAPRAAASLRATGSPYPCSAVSLAVCRRLLEEDVPDRRLRRVRAERGSIAAELRALGFAVTPSQANFVFATGPSPSAATAVAERLAARGVAVRTFTEGSPHLRSSLRVT